MRMQVTIEKGGGYNSMWLRHVTGFRPDRHCADCLLGERVAGGSDLEMFDRELEVRGQLYLCGIYSRFVDGRFAGDWSRNIHVLVEPAEGEVVEVDAVDGMVVDRKRGGWRRLGVRARFTNARLVEIEPIHEWPLERRTEMGIDPRREFYTCRNWQAGRQLYPELASPLSLF